MLKIFNSYRIGIAALFLVFTTSCVTKSKHEVITIHHVGEDPDYQKTLSNFTRKVSVFDGVDTVYYLNVTFFSQPFIEAFSKNLNSETSSHPPVLAGIIKKTNFFVSVFSPNKDANDLSEPKLWTVNLKFQGQTYKPQSIVIQKKKAEWNMYFPYINNWSSDFIVSFDLPIEATQTKNTMELSISNSEARTDLKF